jgi:hypothetical protein
MILDALEPAKQAHRSGDLIYRGGAFNHNDYSDDNDDREAEVYSRGTHFLLDPGVYDLRATLLYVAQRWVNPSHEELTHVNPSGYLQVDFGFGMQFRKAVKGLIAKGKLYEANINNGKQLRFVCLDPALRKLPKLCIACGEKILDDVGRIRLEREQAGAVKYDDSGEFYWLYHKDSATCFEQACAKRRQLDSLKREELPGEIRNQIRRIPSR